MNTDYHLDDAERALARVGKKIDAIKSLRTRTGLGLTEAKAILDREFPLAPAPTPAERLESRSLAVRRAAVGVPSVQAAVLRVAAWIYWRAAQAARDGRSGDGSVLADEAETLVRYAEEIQRGAER